MKKILVVYYSLQGYTREVAKRIAEATNADIFEIEPLKPYSTLSAYTIGILHAQTKATPNIKEQVVNLGDYDVIFIGSPIWAFTMAPPVMTFIKQHNLSEKIVIPFCTHMGNLGKFYEKFSESCDAKVIINGNDFHGTNKKDARFLEEKIKAWINDLNQKINF